MNTFNLDTLDNFIYFIKNNLEKVITLDYETSSLDWNRKDFKLAGLGFGDSTTGCYLAVNTLECSSEISEEHLSKFKELFNYISNHKNLLVFNKSFENPVTKRIFGIEINPVDVLIVATSLNKRSSLKELSRTYLDLNEDSEWEVDIHNFVSSLEACLKLLSPKRTKTVNKHWISFKEQVEEMISVDYFGPVISSIKGLIEAFEYIKSIFERNLSNIQQGYKDFYNLIIDLVNKDITEANYSYIPLEMVSKYCILDTINTTRLFNQLYPMFKEKKLDKSFKNYDKQTNLSIKLEQNSCYWNTEKADSIIETLNSEVLHYMKKLVLNKRTIEYLKIDELKILDLTSTTNIDDLYEYINPRSIKLRPIIEEIMLTTPVKFAVFIYMCREKRESYPRMFNGIKDILYKEHTSLEDLMDSLSIFMKMVSNNEIKLSNSEKTLLMENFKDLHITEFNKETMTFYQEVFTHVLNIDLDSFESIDQYSETSFFFNLFIVKKILKELSSFSGKLGFGKVIDIEEYYNE